MRLRRHPLELDVPPVHRRIVEAGGAEDRHPSLLVDRAPPAERAGPGKKPGDGPLLLPEPCDLGIELHEPRLEQLRRAPRHAAEELANLRKREPSGAVPADRLELLTSRSV